ncbi:MAG: hypothetical protein BGO43_08750 [Gammaproteobacteria bacterium 39-13]|nr:ferric reductase-like transmembrane domain-containing protein [Gammaproteobacteria bacterium]OJV94331.1 MAG: hypothetical protein BGO43_08750 [Gammaproteobacteria bacterium 39-13]
MTRLSGYIALILFITSFYLSARIPIINKFFDGLKRQLCWHHWIAIISVIAMTCHFIQLFWRYINHINLLFRWNDIAILTGWITLIGIILITIFALFRRLIPYRQWRGIHLTSAACLVTALIHTFIFLEPNKLEEWLMYLSLTIFSATALLLSIVLPGFSNWGKKYLIKKIYEIRPKLFLLQLYPTDLASRHFKFEPGHFVYLKFLSKNFSRIWHPFTIISRPSANYIELFIKDRGKDTQLLNTISLPSPVRILAPFGTAFWKMNQSQLWIAYGIGSAIFLAAIRSFPNAFSEKIHFICCDSSESNFFFKGELNRCMKQNPNFTWEFYIGSGQQFVDNFNHKPFDNMQFKLIRICGHPGFQNNLKSALKAKGVRSTNINLEGLL